MRRVKAKDLFINIALILGLSIIFGFMLYSVIAMLQTLRYELNPYVARILPVIGGIVLAIILFVFIEIDTNGIHTNAISIWVNNNKANVFLTCCFLIIACHSVKAEMVFSDSKMVSFITIQWMIFTISAAAYLLYWNAIKALLQRKAPVIEEDKPRLSYLFMKQTTYATTITAKTPLVYLDVNLFALVIITALYFTREEIDLLLQSISFFSFYMCTNTLSVVIFHLFAPIREELRSSLAENKVTAKEINEAKDELVVAELRKRKDGFKGEREYTKKMCVACRICSASRLSLISSSR